ncbi:winged helix-turn-helix domain-containing protein [Serratia marcescens]|jgi:DNA-binding winged helix-turn-helix (wHTH) protein|uniref:Winged helix-turn-helix domain-containing protein n=1 Tax=Serratia surfactantfaciens TaxID=2741499 RepID=A0ABS0M681_9GAMM|nr:winged helix-turn-helix domain-containing protein [Serratia surfactantfaciens]MBH1922364.1 winged helix-turn-helix domain-containing protein [Serratia surfactantfaciens]WMW60513.1 winged helix-turn-helix domain-containing protein [Serratia marcescens]
MKYIINDTILYDARRGTLSLSNNSDKEVVLLKPSQRLLSLFIESNNEIVERERLLDEVWNNHGLTASNNNLSNYISGLRKTLSQLGEDDILVTYPRQGFKLVAESITILASEDTQDEPVEDNPLPKEKRIKPLILALAGGLIATCAALYYYTVGSDLSFIGKYRSCNVFAIDSTQDISSARRLLSEFDYDCSSDASVYLYNQVIDNDGNNTSAMMTYCPRQGRSACKTVNLHH